MPCEKLLGLIKFIACRRIRVHGSHKVEIGGEGDGAVRPADGDDLIFHRLAQHPQHARVELQQLV